MFFESLVTLMTAGTVCHGPFEAVVVRTKVGVKSVILNRETGEYVVLGIA
jgi:fructose-1,6-bisphosphatase